MFERGEAFDFTAPGSGARTDDVGGDGAIAAPMPGQVIAVPVAEGDKVERSSR